jgi:hypothetical protein
MSHVVDIYLIGGNVIRLDVEELEVKRHRETNELLGITYTKAEDATNRPLFVNLEHVSAVVEAC